jgi:hypothetical protein
MNLLVLPQSIIQEIRNSLLFNRYWFENALLRLAQYSDTVDQKRVPGVQERKRQHGLAHSSHAAAHAVFGLAKSW